MTVSYDLVVHAGRAITAAGEGAATVAVRDGVIAAVGPLDRSVTAARVVELAEDEVLLPGLVDSHVHVDEPGRTDWEGFACATKAAAAGGVTTVVDMPLNAIPPTTDVAALLTKRASAAGQCFVDVGFWGGAVPGNAASLAPLHEAGVFGFKCFLVDSGVDEFAPLGADELEADLALLHRLGTVMLVHAEDPAVIAAAPAPAGPDYAAFLRSRPAQAEARAIDTLLAAARRAGARVHVLHLSAAAALPALAAARAEGVAVTVETCPHYLTLAAEQVPDGATAFKCCPPIRDAANRDALWAGLGDGVIDAVVSDHSPCPAALKRTDPAGHGDFGAAWGGIASLQLGLPAVWTQARARGHRLGAVADWMARAPAAVAGLTRKGTIAAGFDADLVVFAPDTTWVVDARVLQHRHPVTPYDGMTLTGLVRRTYLRGHPVDETPRGRLLTRGDA